MNARYNMILIKDIIESCLNQKQSADVFAYIKQIVDLSDIRNEETGEKNFPKRFEKISFVSNDVALAKYLNPSSLQKNKNEREYIPIFPLGCNNSQYIDGGKTVQIVSNSNSAIENVYEKLSSAKYNLGFIVAALGSSKNKKLFIENQDRKYPDFSLCKTEEDPQVWRKRISEQSVQLKTVLDKQKDIKVVSDKISVQVWNYGLEAHRSGFGKDHHDF